MHKSIEEVFEQIKNWTQEDISDYLNKITADEGLVTGGASRLAMKIMYLPNNDFLEATMLDHITRVHKLSDVKALISGWMTDLALGFAQKTKESLLKLTLASFNDYINTINIRLAKVGSEKIGTYIFMVAYLNTIRDGELNGEFSYDAFFSDVEFLSNKVLGRFKMADEKLQKKYNPFSIICNALSNAVDFASKYTIDAEKINDGKIPKHSDINGKNIPSVDSILMQQMFACKLLLSKKMFYLLPEKKRPSKYAEKGDVLFNLNINPEQLNTILSNVFTYAFALDKVQQGQRLEVYKRIKESMSPEEYYNLLKLWQKETSQITGKQIPSTVLKAEGEDRVIS